MSPTGSADAAHLEHVPACPVCAASPGVPWRGGEHDLGRLGRAHLRWVRCPGCRVAWLDPRVRRSQLGALYEEDYAPYADSPVDADDVLGRPPGGGGGAGWQRWQAQLRRVYSADRPGRLLDFGCGSPRVLDAARQRGWTGTGADVTPSVLAAVRAAGHAAIAVDDLWDAPATTVFDVIRLNHVVEHLYEPRAELQRLLSRLAPGGWLHAVTPNPDGLSSRLAREHWHMGVEPRHTVLFPPASLKRLLESLDVVEVVVVPEVVSKDAVRSAASRLGGTRLAGLPTAVPSMAWAALARVTAATGLADRYQVFARVPG